MPSEQRLQWRRDYYQRNKEQFRQSSLARRYGISLDEWNTMFLAQKGCCKICGRHQTEFKKRGLCVDHDHTTGRVRGLLCVGCNVSLGHYEDKDFHDAAQEYLDGLENGRGQDSMRGMPEGIYEIPRLRAL